MLVSILIPCHNAAPYIGAAINSVLAQTWKDLEIVIVNDGSTDNSGSIIGKYLERYTSISLITPEAPLLSAAKARNLAYRHAHGDYIKFFDADDLMHPRMIELQVERLSGHACDVASSSWGRFSRNDLESFRLSPQSVWRDMDARDWLVEAFMDARPMMQPGMFLLHRRLIEKCGLWDEELSLIDDFEFFSRMFSNADLIRFVDGAPLMYRSGLPGSLSGRTSDAAMESAFCSLTRGTSHLLCARNDSSSRRAVANLCQDFIFTYYPRRNDLLRQMEDRIRELGGSDLQPDGPPRFQFLKRFLGWKIARRIQVLVGR